MTAATIPTIRERWEHIAAGLPEGEAAAIETVVGETFDPESEAFWAECIGLADEELDDDLDVQIERALIDTIRETGLYPPDSDDALPIVEALSIEDGGYLTNDRGLSVRFEDGSEYLIRITRQR